ncbi:MAG: tetratricopeptide repeat protein [Chitinispirillaceae bacterium]|nr:tetratricopeptide repeat protein [Chitinispirillaceae bacterium]
MAIMNKINRIVTCLLVAMVALSSPLNAQSIKEGWYLMRGKSNLKIKNYAAAIEAFKAAVKINGNNKEALKLLGQSCELQGMTDQAISTYENYVNKFSDDASIAFKLGDLLQWERYSYRKRDAVKYYRKGLSLENNNVYRYKLAKLLAAKKETSSEAVSEYRKLMKADPQNKTYQKEFRALLLWDDKHLDEAVTEYRKLAQENPDDYHIQYEYAKLCVRDKSYNDEAVKVYTSLVAKRKSDVALREEYADVLAANPQKFNDAKREYEFVLSKNSHLRIREKYADLLSTRQSQRSEAQKQYAIIVKNDPSNVKIRMKYARLLGSNKKTVPEAIRQYEMVLKYQPKNGYAHAGLAKAYAWMGNRDKAACHSALAAKYAPKNKEVIELKRELTRGREPFIGGIVKYLYQPGDWNGINGVAIGAQGRYDILPEMTLKGKIGYETWSAGDKYQGTAKGGVFKAGALYRFETVHAAEMMFGYHSLIRTGDGMELLLQYLLSITDFEVKAGFSRDLLYESIASLAGHDTYLNNRTAWIGSAKNHRFFINAYKKIQFLELHVNPFFGWITSEAADNNAMAGIMCEGRINIPLKETHRGVITYQFSGKRYKNDNSGFSMSDNSAGPGGYFSPQSYLSHNPRFEYYYEDAGTMVIHGLLGPVFYKFNAKNGEKAGVGVTFSGEYKRYLKNNIRLTIGGAFENSGSGYSRFTLNSALDHLF